RRRRAREPTRQHRRRHGLALRPRRRRHLRRIARRGRRARGLAVEAGVGLVSSLRLGIDIGGTKTDAVALAPDGSVAAEHRRATGFGADAVLASAEAAARAVAADLGVDSAEFGS